MEKLKYGLVVVGFFWLFGHVLKVVLPNVSPVSVAGLFRGQLTLWCSVWFVGLSAGQFIAAENKAITSTKM